MKRQVFLISDSTGITIETLGHSLFTQFQQMEFQVEVIRYVNTTEKVAQVLTKLEQAGQRSGNRPLVLSTLVDAALRQQLQSSGAFVLDLMQSFVEPLADELNINAQSHVGHGHRIGIEQHYHQRIDAVNFALENDDGSSVAEYDQADIILVGVSRTGKTPTSLYLAMHYSLRVANYPLVEEDLQSFSLPRAIAPYKDKLFGLKISAERLHEIRQQRRPDSEYASLQQCRYEVRQTDALFRQFNLPCIEVTSMSVEEIATRILQLFNR